MGGFRVDYSGRGELADRQQKLARVMNKLQKAGWNDGMGGNNGDQ